MAENPITAPTKTVPEVRLSVPAHGAFLSLIRTTSAAVAARLEMTIDEIEDLRIAVDEAAAMLLPSVADDRSVDVVFTLGQDELTISLSAHTGDAVGPGSGRLRLDRAQRARRIRQRRSCRRPHHDRAQPPTPRPHVNAPADETADRPSAAAAEPPDSAELRTPARTR